MAEPKGDHSFYSEGSGLGRAVSELGLKEVELWQMGKVEEGRFTFGNQREQTYGGAVVQ